MARVRNHISNPKAKEKLMNAFRFVIKHLTIESLPLAIRLREDYWLEELDPKHRNMKYLAANFKHWVSSNSKDNFFVWLEEVENAQKADVSQGERGGVMYISKAEAETIFKMEYLSVKSGDGINTLIVNQHKVPINTGSFGGKMPGRGAYVIDEKKQIFIAEHQIGILQHSTLAAGEPVICAGEIGIDKGKITEINCASGHFQPNLLNLYLGIKTIPAECFLKNATFKYYKSTRSKNPICETFSEVGRDNFLKAAKEILMKKNKNLFFQPKNPKPDKELKFLTFSNK